MNTGIEIGITHCTSCGAESEQLTNELCAACVVRDAYANLAMVTREREIAEYILEQNRAHPSDVVTIADLTSPSGQTSREAHFEFFLAADEIGAATATGMVSLTLPRSFIPGLAIGATMAVDTMPTELERLAEPWAVGAPVGPLIDTIATMVERIRFARQLACHLKGDPDDRCTLILRRKLLLWTLTEMVDTFRQCGTESERAALPFLERLLDAARDETSPVIEVAP